MGLPSFPIKLWGKSIWLIRYGLLCLQYCLFNGFPNGWVKTQFSFQRHGCIKNKSINFLTHFCMPSPLAPDPIRVQSCVCCLFSTNRNSLAVTAVFLSISLSNPSWVINSSIGAISKWKYLLLLKLYWYNCLWSLILCG